MSSSTRYAFDSGCAITFEDDLGQMDFVPKPVYERVVAELQAKLAERSAAGEICMVFDEAGNAQESFDYTPEMLEQKARELRGQTPARKWKRLRRGRAEVWSMVALAVVDLFLLWVLVKL